MSTKLEVGTLRTKDAAQAYPLVQSVMPDLSLDRWTEFVGDIAAESGRHGPAAGVLVARTDRGYIHGLSCFHMERHPLHRWCLEVDPFIAFEIGRRPDVADALLAAIDALAVKHGCGAVHIGLPADWAKGGPAGSETIQTFEARGHALSRACLCKCLGAGKQAGGTVVSLSAGAP